jgi:hypothetical protein
MNKTLRNLLAAAMMAAGLATAHESTVVPASPARTALYSGDYAAAMKLYRADAEKDPKDAAAKLMYARLKKAVRSQEDFKTEKNSAQKIKIGTSLRQFYYDFNDFERATAVDEELYKLDNSQANAMRLAESYLIINKDKEAGELLDTLADDPEQSQLGLMKTLSAVRGGKGEAAEKLLSEKSFKDFKKLKDLQLYAAIAAKSGELKTASEVMTYILANVPSKMHWQIETLVETSPDFATALQDASFKTAMQTESKVKESGCSGNCASCPGKNSYQSEHCSK